MRRITVATIVASSLALAACAERDTTSPRQITPGDASLAVTPPANTCDGGAVKTAARNAFSSSQDLGVGLAADLAKAIQGANFTTANAKAWALLEDLATERLTPAAPNATNNATLAIDVLRCVSDLSTNPAVKISIPQNFLDNAILILSSGLFDVRGGTAASVGPALGKVIDATSHARAFGAPRWGVEAAATNWFSTQHLVFGYPTSLGTPVLGPTSINSNDILGGGPYNAFELNSAPQEGSYTGLRVGACVKQNLNSGDGTVNRLVHSNSEILINSPPTQLCDPNLVALVPSSSWFANATQRVASFFSVNTAYADEEFTGGLPGGWSPFAYGPVTASGIAISYVVPPTNTIVKTTPADSIVVFAAINNVGVPGVTVSFSIAGNNGRPAGATFEDNSLIKTGITDKNGRVTIKYGLGKAGGYTTTTTGTFDSFAVGNGLSTFVNVKNP